MESTPRFSLIIVLLCIACGTGSSPIPTAASAVSTGSAQRLVVLGDSLAVSPSTAQSFPAQLQRMVQDAELPWVVVNAGVSGDTTTGGVRRVEPLLGPDVDVLVVALGANDGLRGVATEIVSRNLSTIIEAAQRRDIAVLLCGMETPPTRGWDYTVAFHRLFPAAASKHSVPLVPFLLNGVALVPEMNGSDGVHPNATGARRIAENVWPFLEPLLRANVSSRPSA
jgi:acyl-CoA thioesterase-1